MPYLEVEVFCSSMCNLFLQFTNNIISKLVVVLESIIASFLFLLEKSYGFMV